MDADSIRKGVTTVKRKGTQMSIKYTAVILISITLTAVSVLKPLADAASDAPPLRDAYNGGFGLGIANTSAVYWEPGGASVIGRHFDTFVLTDVLSPDVLLNDELTPDYAAADALYAAGAERGFNMVGGALVSYDKTPYDIITTGITREDAINQMRAYINAVITRYPEIKSWIVVDNALGDIITDPADWQSALRDNAWKDIIGADYIQIALDAAREAAPGATLYIADTALHNPLKQRAAYNMLYDIKASGSTVDGVYIRNEFSITSDIENLSDTIKNLAFIGVLTSVEIVRDPSGRDTGGEMQLAYRLAELFTLLDNHRDNIGFAAFSHLQPLFSINFETLPAYDSVSDPAAFIAAHPHLARAKALRTFSIAEYGTPRISALDIDPIWDSARVISVNNYIEGEGADGTAADVRVMWNRENLYVYATVYRDIPDPADSVTIFINEDINNPSDEFCASYTLNAKDELTAGFNTKQVSIVFSRTPIEGGYIMQMQIPMRQRYSQNDEIGFDIRITNMRAGNVASVAQLNDLSGLVPDPVNWGRLILQSHQRTTDTAPVSLRDGVYKSQSTAVRVSVTVSITILTVMMCTLIYYSKKQRDEKFNSAMDT